MYSYENFTKYLQESKDNLDEKVIQMGNFIYKNDLLNVIYEVSNTSNPVVAKITHIGAPSQIIDVLSHSVSVPLKQIEINIEQTPVLRRVHAEQKSIYFRKIPELVAGLIPDIKYQHQTMTILKGLGITDIAALPVTISNPKYNKEYILAVLGPLDDDQKQFIKNVANELTNHFNK